MDLIKKITDWSDAHVFYSSFLQNNGADLSVHGKKELAWRNRMISEATNGNLLISNSFFDQLKKGGKLFFLHITPNLNSILESNSVYSSGGCLVGAIYATPLNVVGNRMFLHNLGRYIYEKEAPKSIYYRKTGNHKLDSLIFEVTIPGDSHNNLIGIDYTRLGKIHLNIYKELEYLLSFPERLKIYDSIIGKIKKTIPYLNFANATYLSGEKINYSDFFNLFIPAIGYLPILGYLYFEAVSEYLMLFQDCLESQLAKKDGEFYNQNYKELMFNLFPDLLKGKTLSIFAVNPNKLADYVEKNKIISNFDKEHMLNYLADRLVMLTNSRLLCSEVSSDPVNWFAIKWDFDYLSLIAPGLLGHLIHRELRNFGRYPDFYFYFDQFKALQAWNYWNHMDISIPFNGFIPKGEMGINPASTNLKYKVFSSNIMKDSLSKKMFAEIGQELPIKLVPRLVDLRFTTMHSLKKCHQKNIQTQDTISSVESTGLEKLPCSKE